MNRLWPEHNSHEPLVPLRRCRTPRCVCHKPQRSRRGSSRNHQCRRDSDEGESSIKVSNYFSASGLFSGLSRGSPHTCQHKSASEEGWNLVPPAQLGMDVSQTESTMYSKCQVRGIGSFVNA